MRAAEGKRGQHLLERSHQVWHDRLTHRERKLQPVTVVLGVRDVAGDENAASAVADEGESIWPLNASKFAAFSSAAPDASISSSID